MIDYIICITLKTLFLRNAGTMFNNLYQAWGRRRDGLTESVIETIADAQSCSKEKRTARAIIYSTYSRKEIEEVVEHLKSVLVGVSGENMNGNSRSCRTESNASGMYSNSERRVAALCTGIQERHSPDLTGAEDGAESATADDGIAQAGRGRDLSNETAEGMNRNGGNEGKRTTGSVRDASDRHNSSDKTRAPRMNLKFRRMRNERMGKR